MYFVLFFIDRCLSSEFPIHRFSSVTVACCNPGPFPPHILFGWGFSGSTGTPPLHPSHHLILYPFPPPNPISPLHFLDQVPPHTNPLPQGPPDPLVMQSSPFSPKFVYSYTDYIYCLSHSVLPLLRQSYPSQLESNRRPASFIVVIRVTKLFPKLGKANRWCEN